MPNNDASKQDTIQDIALKLAEEQMKQLQLETQPKERVVFVLGSKGVGKTTVINTFFEREEAPKPTLALDYSYGRKLGAIQKHLVHVWELGSLDNAEDLIKIPMKSHGIEQLGCVIMLDLTQPRRIWEDLKETYEKLRDFSDEMLSKGQGEAHEQMLYEKAKERVKKDHVDINTLQLLPFPVVIVGGKYDLFINFEPSMKNNICLCLRSMAHLMGASLLFYSSKIQKLSKTLKDCISHLAFGSPSHPFRVYTIDYNDALSIWFGTDSWQKISSMGPQSIGSIEAKFVAEIPQEEERSKGGIKNIPNPAKDPGFHESIIDEMRSQKEEELRAIVRDTQMRGKFKTVEN